MQRFLILAMVSTGAVVPALAQGPYQGLPPVAPAIQANPSPNDAYQQSGYAPQTVPYQGMQQALPYYPQAQSQQAPGQVDPSVPGNSSLTPGEYVMTNRTTGQNMYVTVTPNGQMYTQDAPPAAAPALTASAATNEQQGTAAASTSQQQPASSKLSVVGSALKGALGMYYQYKYGGSGGYPMYGGYGYPMYGGGYAPSTGGGGFFSNLLSRF